MKKRSKNVRRLTLDGITATMHEHSERLGVTYGKIYSALRHQGLTLKKDFHVRPAELLPVSITLDLSDKRPKPKIPEVKPARFCLRCGHQLPIRLNQKYCNVLCRTGPPKPKPEKKPKLPKPAKPMLPCEHCGNLFLRTIATKRFCSEKCGNKAYLKRRPQKPPSNTTHEKGTCALCQGPLPIPRYTSKKYCSDSCKNKAANKRGWQYIKNNPHSKLRARLSSRLKECMKRAGKQKKNSILKYLGCTPQELRDHLQSKFQPGMTWDNYGVFGWHIDHIIPCASFDLTREDHINVCFHYSNLQPLWSLENSLKQDNHTINIPVTLKDKAFKVGVLVL